MSAGHLRRLGGPPWLPPPPGRTQLSQLQISGACLIEQLLWLIIGQQGPQVAASDWRGWAERGLRIIKGQGGEQ